MFQSLLQFGAENVIAAVLTGMGNDGAFTIKKLREAGAKTIAQNKETCVVWGMPRAVEEIGGADYILRLKKLRWSLLNYFKLKPTIGPIMDKEEYLEHAKLLTLECEENMNRLSEFLNEI